MAEAQIQQIRQAQQLPEQSQQEQQPNNQPAISLADEPRVTSLAQYSQILDNAYMMQYTDALRQNPPSSKLEGIFQADLQAGIPVSVLTDHLVEQTRAANAPLERGYIERAISNHFPPKEKVEEALRELGYKSFTGKVCLTNEVRAKRRIKLMRHYESGLLAALKDAFPISEFSVSYGHSVHWYEFEGIIPRHAFTQLISEVKRDKISKGGWLFFWRKGEKKIPLVSIKYCPRKDNTGDVDITFKDPRAVIPCNGVIGELNRESVKVSKLNYNLNIVNGIY